MSHDLAQNAMHIYYVTNTNPWYWPFLLHLKWGLLLSSALPNSPLIFLIVLCYSIDPQLNRFLTPILPIISILSWLLQIPWFYHSAWACMSLLLWKKNKKNNQTDGKNCKNLFETDWTGRQTQQNNWRVNVNKGSSALVFPHYKNKMVLAIFTLLLNHSLA